MVPVGECEKVRGVLKKKKNLTSFFFFFSVGSRILERHFGNLNTGRMGP